MKKFLCLLLSMVICFSSFAVVCNAEPYHTNWVEGETTGETDMSDWFPWKWPDESLAKGTALDSSFLNDKPAGKHGFLGTDGPNFVFDDGTRFRLWGVNVGYQTCFMYNKEDLVVMADRIARQGFNAVRFHQWDASRRDNIFGLGQISTVSDVDPVQLDKLHYFMSLLKERGIYWYFDIMVQRAYIPDGENILDVRTYESQGSNVYTGVFFDEKLQESYIKIIGQVLGSVNPYTGISGFEDPALICISLANEYSFLGGKVFDDYDRLTITSLFNKYLAEKYETREALEKAWEEKGKLGLQSDEDPTKGTVDYLENGTLLVKEYLEQKNPSEARYNDLRDFIYDIQLGYDNTMVEELRKRYGAKCLFTGVDMGNTYNHNMENNHINTARDFVSGHMYKAHPTDFAYGTGTNMTGWSSTTRTIGTELWRTPPWCQLANKPYVLGEWAAVSPIPYSAEGVFTNAVAMAYQNWNSMYFAWYSNWEFREDLGHTDFFASMEVADISLSFPGAAAIFLRGDVKPADKSYYITSNKRLAMDTAGYGEPTGLNDIWLYVDTGAYFEDGLDGAEYTPTPEALDEAYREYANNEPQNDQLQWNKRSGLFKLDTEYSNLAAGSIGGKAIENEYSTIELENYTAVIALTSATGKALKESESVLVTTVSRSRNTGSLLDPTGYTIMTPGTGPQLIEPVVADITIKLTDDIKVYALDFNGQRKAELPIEKTKEGYSRFKADGHEYKAVHYEIVK